MYFDYFWNVADFSLSSQMNMILSSLIYRHRPFNMCVCAPIDLYYDQKQNNQNQIRHIAQ